MRLASAILLAIAIAAIQPQIAMAVGAGAVSVLLESLPYLVLAAVCSPLIGRYARALVAYAGLRLRNGLECAIDPGCGGGGGDLRRAGRGCTRRGSQPDVALHPRTRA